MQGCWRVVPAVALALMLLFASAKGEARSIGSASQSIVIGDWQLVLAEDKFSGERRCRLATRRGTAFYSRGIVSIRLSKAFDLTETVFRVDGLAPTLWRNLIPELAQLDPGFASNRTPEILPIPAQPLDVARLIEISLAFGKRAQAFRIEGLGASLQRAASLGCRLDAAVVR